MTSTSSGAVFACYSKVCAPPPAGRGGSTKGGGKEMTIVSGTGSHTDGVVSVAATRTNIRALNRELDAQGVAPDHPIRGVINEGYGFGSMAVSRSDGRIEAAVHYFFSGKHVIIDSLRAMRKGGGHGTKVMAQAMRHSLERGKNEASIYGAVQSALPFYAKIGAVPKDGAISDPDGFRHDGKVPLSTLLDPDSDYRWTPYWDRAAMEALATESD